VNPCDARQKISLRVHNLNSPTLDLNQRAGASIEVAAVVVRKVAVTVRAVASSRWYVGDAHGADSPPAALDAQPVVQLGKTP